MGKNSKRIKESVRLQMLKQYFTPELVAKWICETYVKDSDIDILEPSCGRGVFLKHIPIFGARQILGMDVDPTLSKHWASIHSDQKQFVVEDFLKESPWAGSTSIKYDLIIGNPPFGKVNGEGKHSLDVQFVLKALSLLKSSGRIVFLLESKFLHGVERYNQIWGGIASLLSLTVISRRVRFEDEEGLLTSVGTRDCCIFEMSKYRENVRTDLRWTNMTF